MDLHTFPTALPSYFRVLHGPHHHAGQTVRRPSPPSKHDTILPTHRPARVHWDSSGRLVPSLTRSQRAARGAALRAVIMRLARCCTQLRLRWRMYPQYDTRSPRYRIGSGCCCGPMRPRVFFASAAAASGGGGSGRQRQTCSRMRGDGTILGRICVPRMCE